MALPGIGCQRPPTGSRPPTPRPVPGPITPIAWPGSGVPPPICSRSSTRNAGHRHRLGGEVVDDVESLELEGRPASR